MSGNELKKTTDSSAKGSARKLTFCATCVALATLGGLIPLIPLPFGGSVTFFSLLFMVLPAWFYGLTYGLGSAFVVGILTFMFNPYYLSVPQFVFDYILAFTVMGVGGLFYQEPNGLVKGYVLGVFLRWIMASIAGYFWVLAGMTIWEGWSPLPYTLAYNAIYIFAEAAVTLVILLFPAVRNVLEKIKGIANGTAS